MKFLQILLGLFLVAQPTGALAHTLWVNCFESNVHSPGHAIVSLGWGHALPLDDILNSPNGRVNVSAFTITDPAGKTVQLYNPPLKESKPFVSNRNYSVFPGDIGVQRISLEKEGTPGVYQLAAMSRPAFYTKYIDTKGRKRMKLKPKDELKDIKKVLMSVKYEASAKSFFTVGSWQEPEPLGHGLEIIPKTDLSNVRIGDMVEVKVLYHGTPLNNSANSAEFITASSSSFGQGEGFSLFSAIVKGKAQFRVQSPGQWRVVVKHKDEITKDGPLKALVGKADQAYHAATMTFSVK
ncbi:DUF4198 domain-containing protein [Maridesulfovibrio sp.]|uniref:DUF4198 domain-containing protein n=1 Tax=Maridesulfovibrio sp. TaxID=2795000 RepID=UPI003BAA93E0